MVSLFKDLCFIYQFFNALTGVNNVKATDRRRRYGSDGAPWGRSSRSDQPAVSRDGCASNETSVHAELNQLSII